MVGTTPQSVPALADKVNKLGTAWEQFKRVNDERLQHLEKKGQSDPLYDVQLKNINTALDQVRGQMDRIETVMYRPAAGSDSEAKMGSHAREHKQAFCNYLRKGIEHGLLDMEMKALTVGTPADGGYLVTSAMSDYLVKLANERVPMRRLARVENISTDTLDIIQDYDAAAAGWTTETGTVNDTTTPQISKKAIDTFELYAQPKATQKLIDDAVIDIEQWIAEKIAEVFANYESDAFINGDGTTQPKGILSYTAGTSFGEVEQVESGTDGQVTADGIIALYYALKEAYASRGTFLMHRNTVQQVRLLKETTTGQYLWQPGLASGQPDTLMGAPVVTCADMPVPATDGLSVAFGDFRAGYQIVDRTGVRILRDPFTSKPYVRFYATKRVGGEVINSEAIKILKLAAS